MDENEPYLPEVDLKVERAVGRFIIAWGALESQIDRAIQDLLLTNIATGAIVTANLAIRAKLDLAHALFEALRCQEGEEKWRLISQDWEQRFDTLINMTAKANSTYRNPIVHSQPILMKLEQGDVPFWLQASARKGGWRGTGVTYTEQYLDSQTEAVNDLTREWAAARLNWKSAVHGMRSAAADEWLNRRPDDQDQLTLQLRSIPDAQNPNQKSKLPKKT